MSPLCHSCHPVTSRMTLQWVCHGHCFQPFFFLFRSQAWHDVYCVSAVLPTWRSCFMIQLHRDIWHDVTVFQRCYQLTETIVVLWHLHLHDLTVCFSFPINVTEISAIDVTETSAFLAPTWRIVSWHTWLDCGFQRCHQRHWDPGLWDSLVTHFHHHGFRWQHGESAPHCLSFLVVCFTPSCRILKKEVGDCRCVSSNPKDPQAQKLYFTMIVV